MAFQIGYKNLLTDADATVTASSEATGYEVANCYDGLGFDWWKPTATGQSWVKAAFTVGKPADYMAVWGHNLGDATCGIRPQYSDDDITWVDADTQINKTDNDTVYFNFTSSERKYWRVLVDTDPNKLLWSEDFTNAAWQKSTGVSVTANAAAAPDGTLTADQVDYDGTGVSGSFRIWQSAGTLAASDLANSIWIKALAPITLDLAANSPLVRESFGITTAWQKIDVSNAYTGIGGAQLLIYSDVGDNTPFTIYLSAAQLEEGSTAGEYIKKTTATTTIPAIAGIQIGETMEMPHGAEVGFAVPTIAPKVELKTARSESGAFIGGSQLSQGIEGSFNFTNIDPAWVRTNWEPFIAHAQTPETFVISWDTTTYTTEIMHAWADGQIPAPSYSSPLYMNFSLKFKGNK